MSREAVAFLSSSPDRRRLLAHLSDRPSTPRDVTDAVDISKRSAQRNLTNLVERGWAEKHDGEYRLTTTGRLVYETYVDCVDAIERIDSFDALYRHLPAMDDAPDPDWLADATYVDASEDYPQAPVDYYVDIIETVDTDCVLMLAPVLSRQFQEPHAKQVLDGAETELVLPNGRVEAAHEMNPLEFKAVVSVPRFTLYRYDGEAGFGLTVVDGRAFLLAYDEDGQLRALVDSTDGRLVSWATDMFEKYREDAAAVDGPTGPF